MQSTPALRRSALLTWPFWLYCCKKVIKYSLCGSSYSIPVFDVTAIVYKTSFVPKPCQIPGGGGKGPFFQSHTQINWLKIKKGIWALFGINLLKRAITVSISLPINFPIWNLFFKTLIASHRFNVTHFTPFNYWKHLKFRSLEARPVYFPCNATNVSDL